MDGRFRTEKWNEGERGVGKKKRERAKVKDKGREHGRKGGRGGERERERERMVRLI